MIRLKKSSIINPNINNTNYLRIQKHKHFYIWKKITCVIRLPKHFVYTQYIREIALYAHGPNQRTVPRQKSTRKGTKRINQPVPCEEKGTIQLRIISLVLSWRAFSIEIKSRSYLSDQCYPAGGIRSHDFG